MGNLPVQDTSFVGRRHECIAIVKALSNTRLVTLTGSGGVGKTRLALRTGDDLKRAFRDGVWFVDLAPLGNSAHLANVIADAVGLRLVSSMSTVEALTEHLAPREALLLLDTCEHLIERVAVLVNQLLLACPKLHVLATSREPLGIKAEAVIPVRPLSCPPVGVWVTRNLTDYEAVSLFLERVRAAAPGFRLTDDSREHLVAICRQLGGIPLALELTAVGLRRLSPRQLLDHLSDHFEPMNVGSRGAPDLERTLRACFEWSSGRCTEEERALWRRASVFSGGFEVDAAEFVCGSDELSGRTLVDSLLSLIDKSILIGEVHDGQMRYRMPEAVRQYGDEQLRRSGEFDAVGRRHLRFSVGLAERLVAELAGPHGQEWMRRLRREQANLRAALEFSEVDGDVEAGLRLAYCLHSYWVAVGALAEATHWCHRLLHHGEVSPTARAEGLLTAGRIATVRGDLETARSYLQQGDCLACDLDERMRALFDQTWALYYLYEGDHPRSIAKAEQALTVFRRSGDPALELLTLNGLQMALADAGNTDQALARHRECVEIADRVGDTWYKAMSLWHVGIVRWRAGCSAAALSDLDRALRLMSRSANETGIAVCLEALAWVTTSINPHRAAGLLGAAAACRTMAGLAIARLPWMGLNTECEAQLRQKLGSDRFESALDWGRRLDARESITFALEEGAEPEATGNEPKTPPPLTRREHEVAALVGRGLSNKEIANTLVISKRTADSHVEHILTKLGFGNRAQIAAWMAELRLLQGCRRPVAPPIPLSRSGTGSLEAREGDGTAGVVAASSQGRAKSPRRSPTGPGCPTPGWRETVESRSAGSGCDLPST